MNIKINSLEQLEEVAELVPASEEDREIIEEMLDKDIEVSYDYYNRVFSENGTYIADLKEKEQ